MRVVNKKSWLKIVLIFLSFFLISEWYLRVYWGFCDAVLFRTDNKFEYIEIPQKRFRFRQHIFYNKYSQRNEEISPKDTLTIAGFGDSILNGGVLSDQDSIATTLLTAYLRDKFKKNITVLNIAAPSWGPDNCYAYLKKYGDFGCKKIFLVVSSHDSFDDMTFDKNVIDINHPDKQYKLAWAELINRYVLPKLKRKPVPAENLFINKRKENTPFNTGFLDFYNYCTAKNIPLLIYLHADYGERIAHNYNYQGKLIIDFCNRHQIKLVKELDYQIPLSSYRDGIHFNNSGQRNMFEILKINL